MSPKVIQIAVEPPSDSYDGCLYLLFDNGDVWYRMQDGSRRWVPMDIPEYDNKEEMPDE